MKKIIISVALILFFIITSAALQAEPVAVIVNIKNNNKITPSTIRAIYSDLQLEWSDGSRIKLYELPSSTDARNKFAKAVLNKTAVATELDWNNRKITNVINNRPHVKRDKLVVKRVARDKYAVGYVPKSLIKGVKGVKIVMTID